MRCHTKAIFIVLWILLMLFPTAGFTADNANDTTLVPFTNVFYGMGGNMIGSCTYNCGLNYIVGAAASYGLVETGADWRWYRNAVEHPWIYKTGRVSMVTGPIVSVALPLGLYLYGRSEKDADLQITGLALGSH